MTKILHRFFVHPAAIKEEKVAIIDQAQVHQLIRVLRLKEGRHLIVLDNKGREIEVEVVEMSKKKVVCRFVEERTNASEPDVLIRLFQGLTKQASKFEEVLKHGTELGVTEFYPLLTQNGESQELRKRERMEHILKEAAEQSERGRIPALGNEIKFSSILVGGWPEELGADVTLLAYAREEDVLLNDVIRQLGSPKTINLIIGPEGGFTEEEVERARAQGFMIFGLGPRILRTETAGVAVVAALLLT